MARRARGSVTVNLWLPVVLYMAGIFALSSISSPPGLVGGVDKPLHVLLYSGLAAVLVRALSNRWRHVTLRVVMAAIVVATLYGVTDEWHQRFVPPREVEAFDVVADAFGAALAAFALYGLFRKRRQGEGAAEAGRSRQV